MSIWSAMGSWAMGQFTNNFLDGGSSGSGGDDIWGKVISAGATTLSKNLFDKKQSGGKRFGPGDVDFGVTSASTYKMASAEAPETPEGADYELIRAKWTRIAKRLGEIQDTTANVG